MEEIQKWNHDLKFMIYITIAFLTAGPFTMRGTQPYKGSFGTGVLLWSFLLDMLKSEWREVNAKTGSHLADSKPIQMSLLLHAVN